MREPYAVHSGRWPLEGSREAVAFFPTRLCWDYITTVGELGPAFFFGVVSTRGVYIIILCISSPWFIITSWLVLCVVQFNSNLNQLEKTDIRQAHVTSSLDSLQRYTISWLYGIKMLRQQLNFPHGRSLFIAPLTLRLGIADCSFSIVLDNTPNTY